MDSLIAELPRFGLPGVLTGILIYLYVRKDQELKRERDARIADAHNVTTLVLQLNSKIHEAIDRLERICEVVSIDRDRRT